MLTSLHLSLVGQSYLEHLTQAFKVSFNSIFGGILMFYHGIFPDLFPQLAGNMVIHAREILHGQRCKVVNEKRDKFRIYYNCRRT